MLEFTGAAIPTTPCFWAKPLPSVCFRTKRSATTRSSPSTSPRLTGRLRRSRTNRSDRLDVDSRYQDCAALKCVRENSSFAPLGLAHFSLVSTACAVGCILAPLRGCKPSTLVPPRQHSNPLGSLKPCNLETLKPAFYA